MATVKITDVVIPEVYNDYFRENSIYKSALWRSGIMRLNTELNRSLDGGAYSFSTPFWKTNDVIGATATPVNQDGAVTPGKIGTGTMTVARQFREYAWSSDDVASVLAGDSAMSAMMAATEEFWNRNYQAHTFKTVQGVIADNVDNDSSTMIKDITGETGLAGYINPDAIVDTFGLFGDQGSSAIVGVAMHSTQYLRLQKYNLIDSIPDNQQDVGWGTYMGKSVIVDDTLIDSSSDYWMVAFKAGAFSYGFSDMRYEMTETDRAPAVSGGQDLYYTRRVFAIHPYGFSYTIPDSPTYTFPSDAEIAAAAQWDNVMASVKNVGFVVLKSNG